MRIDNMHRYGYLITTVILSLVFSATTGCAATAASTKGAAKAPAAGKTASGVSKLGHAIQMGAFSDVKNAERFTARLQAKGIEAFYFKKDNGIYAVRFGDFPSREKARATAEKLVAERLIDSYYIAPPNEVVFSGQKHPATVRTGSDTRLPSPTKAVDRQDTQISKTPPPAVSSSHTKTGERNMGFIAARTAERFIGIPYQWGGDTVVDGMDCSGFSRAVYNLCGISIPRTSRDQYKAGTPVDRQDLKDGDLVFFGASVDKISHVGIYVGSGKFVHAPRRGEEIREASIDDSYFERRFVGARRYFQ
jgi:cell wall-associated NlpC family hydrolase